MKLFYSFLLIFILSFSLSARRPYPAPPYSKPGDKDLRYSNNITLKHGKRCFYRFNTSSAIRYYYKFKISNKKILKREKLYRLTPMKIKSKVRYTKTVDYIYYFRALKRGRTTLTVYYFYRNKLKWKNVIRIKVI